MPFDKFGMLIKEDVEEPESDEVVRYAFAINDGEHTDILETFDSLEEGMKYYEEQEKEVEKDPEKYFDLGPKSDWTDDCYPHIELREIDEEGIYVDDVLSWHPDLED